MKEDYNIGLVAAMLMATAFRSRAEIERRRQDPEYAAAARVRELEKAEAQYSILYEQANADNAEYECSPRSFRRRLKRINEGIA